MSIPRELMKLTSDEEEQEGSRSLDLEVGDLGGDRWDEYMLFRLLERQRISKLKELYDGNELGTLDTRCNTQQEDAFSLKLPPRYQCINLSHDVFLSVMNMQLQELSISNKDPEQQWRSELDDATLRYIADLAKELNARHSTQTRSSTPVHFLPLNSTTVTPPSTPLLSSFDELEISPLSLDMPPESGRDEVDLTDEEIMLIWSCTLPSDDGVDFDMFQ